MHCQKPPGRRSLNPRYFTELYMNLDTITRQSLLSYPQTDAGNSERLIARHGHNIRYIQSWGTWIAWKGSRWETDPAYLYRMAELTARATYEEACALPATSEEQKAARKAAKSFARKSESRASIEATIKLARYRAGVALSHEKLDANPTILPVHNGTIDLETGKLRNPKREDHGYGRFTWIYDPDGNKIELWQPLGPAPVEHDETT